MLPQQFPYAWLNPILVYASATSLVAFLAFLALSFVTRAPSKRRLRIASVGCFFLFLGLGVANYALIFLVQSPPLPPDQSPSRRLGKASMPDTLTSVGDKAPDFHVNLPDGSSLRLADLRGKVLLLNFFATWCGPCRKELPHLQELWDEYHRNDEFAMLIIGREESSESLASFMSKEGYTFPVAADPKRKAYGKFATKYIPRTYVISRDGIILYQCKGFGKTEITNLKKVLENEISVNDLLRAAN